MGNVAQSREQRARPTAAKSACTSAPGDDPPDPTPDVTDVSGEAIAVRWLEIVESRAQARELLRAFGLFGKTVKLIGARTMDFV